MGAGSLLYGEVPRDRRPLKRENPRNCIGGIRRPRNGTGGSREKPVNKGLRTIEYRCQKAVMEYNPPLLFYWSFVSTAVGQ